MADHGDAVNASLPLKGAVLCCTALTHDVRTKLAEVATQMGAVHKLDLTSDVTHLFVGSINTPKYRYVAKERPDIKVLHPDWIESVRQSWMQGGDVDVGALEDQHLLPVFSGLVICVTGFDNHEQRSWISDTVQEKGAAYHGDLTRQVTHLIAAAPQGAKYTHAMQWGINIVSLKWFEDSLRRGMALDESLYDPVMPDEAQGEGATRERAVPRTSLGKREREGDSQSGGDVSKRKLRRTASTRLNSQSQDMWQDMSARETGIETLERDQWKDANGANEETVPINGDVSLARSETLPGGETFEPDDREGKAASRPTTRQSSAFQPPDSGVGPGGLFFGAYILIHGFDRDKRSRLQHYLEPNGARVVQTNTELQHASRDACFSDRYLLVPHAAPVELPDISSGTKLVTEWWVERCIHYKRRLEPSEDPLSEPFRGLSISGFGKGTICATGFSGVDVRQIAEAVRLMGAKYEENLTPAISVLISGSSSVKKEKAYYATKHGIPVVSPAWLWECLKQGNRVPYDNFLVQLPPFDPQDTISGPSSGSSTTTDAQRRSNIGRKTKDDGAPKRLSNTRRRHATPTLPLQASRSSTVAPPPRRQLFVHEDDEDGVPSFYSEPTPAVAEDPAPVSPQRSQPLQELSPNLSPRKGSQHVNDQAEVKNDANTIMSLDGNNSRPSSKPLTAPTSPRSLERSQSNKTQQPALTLQRDLTADLASILSRQIASRQDSTGSDIPQKRKNRPLGRSTSGIGNRSASASARSDTASPSLYRSETADSAADGFGLPKEVIPAPPSTQLGYETADAEMHRLQMNKRMGLAPDDGSTGTRVASVGLVRDSVMSGGDASVGSRVRGKTRSK